LVADFKRDFVSVIAHIESLSLGYSEEPLFSGLSLDIYEGMMLAVVGANGTGKSTFVKTVLGLHDPKIGTIHWPKGRPDEIGYLAQLSEFDRRFPIRVRDLAAMGAWKGFNPFSGLNAAARKKVDQALDQAGVLDLAERPLHTLSGGQLQLAPPITPARPMGPDSSVMRRSSESRVRSWSSKVVSFSP